MINSSLLQLSFQSKLGPFLFSLAFLRSTTVAESFHPSAGHSPSPDIPAAFSVNCFTALNPHFLYSPAGEQTHHTTLSRFPSPGILLLGLSLALHEAQNNPSTKMIELPLLKSCLLIDGRAAV